MNNQLARQLLSNQDSWEMVSFEQADRAPEGVTRWLNQQA
jgi:UDP-3-O-[3-hydroxymyristoyl] N-acetylglucosamine deacetylase